MVGISPFIGLQKGYVKQLGVPNPKITSIFPMKIEAGSFPKDPDMSVLKGITPIFLWPGDGIETINPILGRGLDP